MIDRSDGGWALEISETLTIYADHNDLRYISDHHSHPWQQTTYIKMASSAGLRTRSTRHIVVCGAVDIRDIWLFGDFLGFTSFLKEHSVHGTFISCFDLDGYFTNTNSSDVKFGRKWESPDGEYEIAIYTRSDWHHHTRWWTQLEKPDVENARAMVLEWIADSTKTAKTGDILTIILIGNGTTTGGIELDGRFLEPVTLANACSHLPVDVQLNIVVKSCYSGISTKDFETSRIHSCANAKRDYRNSLFGSTLVKTLGLQPEGTWKLIEHDGFIKSQCEKPTNPSQQSIHPVLTTSNKTELMKPILFQDYVNVSILIPPQRARRVISPPSVSYPVPSADMKLNATYQSASAFIEAEMGMTYTDIPDPDDMGLVQTWFMPWSSASIKAQAIQEILHGFVFRWLAQERVLMVAEDLIGQGLLDIKSFYKAMDLAGNQDYTDSVMTVYKLLSSFTLGSDCLEHSDLPGKPFISPLRWLSIIICRSCYHWDLTINRWVSLQLLGKPVEGVFGDLLRQDMSIHIDPDEAVNLAEDNESYILPQVGFWLPNGMQMNDFVGPWMNRYNGLKSIYEATGNDWPGDPGVENVVARLLAIESGQLQNH